MFKGLKPILYGGREVWPLVEGGKGVSATNHMSSGAWAAAGGIGTVSAVNADSYDAEGKIVPQVYRAATRRERHEELVRYAIDGAVEQVRRAYDVASGKGAININVLWEMGGAQQVLEGVLEKTRGLVTGVTCGAVGYLASQPWPFPASLMIGARTEATGTAITLDPLPTKGPTLATRLWLGFAGALLLGIGIGGWFQLRRIRSRRAPVRS